MTFKTKHAVDTADIHLLAMTHPEANGERFLTASDGSVSVRNARHLAYP